MKKMKLTLASVIVAGRCYESKLQKIKIPLQNHFGGHGGPISDNRYISPFANAAWL